MAEVVNEVPKRNTKSKYNKYFDGQLWRLTTGVDCPNINTAAGAIKNVAKYLGIKVTVSTRSAENAVYVQAHLEPK